MTHKNNRPIEIYKHLNMVTSIKEKEPPKDKKITVFCDNGKEDIGFCENLFFDEIGINVFIAKKWILQEDLERIFNEEI